MNVRATMSLVAVFAILAGVVWYFELREQPKAADPTQPPIFDLKSEDVQRVQLVSEGKTVAVERDASGPWRLVAPDIGEADVTRVDDVVGRLAKLVSTRKLDDATDLSAYGLSTPASLIELKMRDGTSYELEVGAMTPDKSAYYVKRADSPAVFTATSFTIGDVTRWATDPPKPRPTPTPLPPLPSPATTPAG